MRTAEDWIEGGNDFGKNGQYEEAIKCYAEATRLNPKNDSAFFVWGIALFGLAQIKQDEKLFKESFGKYAEATRLNPTNYSAFNNWGIALYELAKIKQDEKLIEEGMKKCQKAYDLNKVEGYNLACGYALLEKKGKALHYLEESIKNKDIDIDYVSKDEDWKNYLTDEDFINLLNQYK